MTTDGLTVEEEAAIRDQLTPEATAAGRPTLDTRRVDLRPLFIVSVKTGLRWSEQRRLEWRDVDFLTGLRQSKSGHSRQVQMNSVVRAALFDLASLRREPNNPEEPVFRCPYGQPDRFFPKAVERAQTLLRLGSFPSFRTFASRLAMARVDLRTIWALGGWRTVAMVQRYSHLAPDHLHAAVGRLVQGGGAVEVSRNCPETEKQRAGVS